jgi:mono/diheme cytochrome c family protein
VGLATAAGAAYVASMVSRGFSARERPSRLEVAIAGAMRSLAMPAGARSRPNPFKPTAEALAQARAHFADHCALCHANNGSGETEMGRNLYPKAPDMRLPATQNKTDGELFYVIRNGIRLTGMPAWGKEGGESEDEDSWKLALFIHDLSQLTPEEEREMNRLNPKSVAELEEQHAEEEFLRGGAPAEPQGTSTHSPHRQEEHR